MSKQLLFVLLLFFGTLAGFAEGINVEQAKAIATAFVNQQSTPGGVLLKQSSPQETMHLLYKDTPDDSSNYYVFTLQEGKGFVIVSGHNNENPILAYADQGIFDINNLPEAMKVVLHSYSIALSTVTMPATGAAEVITPVDPMTDAIKWGQGSPYNMQIPSGYPAGCVAMAMAIVMKHNEWPVKGVASNSYEWNNIQLSADFNTTYAWDKMLYSYTGSNITNDKIDAVAGLVYNCAVSVNMNFNNTSTSSLLRASKALPGYFGYDENIRLLQAEKVDAVTRAEWAKIVRDELKAGRPVIYGGQNNKGGGHAFIIDGCKSDGTFHINWGWNGIGNGYFSLDNLDANVGNGDYSFSCQEILYNIKKAKHQAPSVPIDGFSPLKLSDRKGGVGLVTNAENIELGKAFRVQARTLENPLSSPDLHNIPYAVALVDKDFNIKYVDNKSIKYSTFYSGSFMATPLNWFACVIPANADVIIEDTDRICLVTGKTGSNDWQIVGSKTKDIAYWVKARNNQVKKYKVTVDAKLYGPQNDPIKNLIVKYTPAPNTLESPDSFEDPLFGNRVLFRVGVYNTDGTDISDEYIVSVRVDGETLYPWFLRGTRNEYAIETLQKDETIVVKAYPKDGSTCKQYGTALLTTTAGGQLSDKLVEEYRDVANKVIVKGPIDTRDFVVLNKCMNNMQELDLSEATIQPFNVCPSNTIPIDAFNQQFKKLNTVILPNTLTSIAAGAFAGCANLEHITIPAGVKSIGLNAFNGTNARDVTVLGSDPVKISWCVFNQTKREEGGAVLNVPKGKVSSYKADAEWGKWDRVKEIDKNPCNLILPNVPFVEFSDVEELTLPTMKLFTFKARLSDELTSGRAGWSLEIRSNGPKVELNNGEYQCVVSGDDLLSNVIIEATVVKDLSTVPASNALMINPGMVVTLTGEAHPYQAVRIEPGKVGGGDYPAATVTLRNIDLSGLMVKNDVNIILEEGTYNVIGGEVKSSITETGLHPGGIFMYYNKKVALSGTGTLAVDYIGGYRDSKGTLNICHGVGLRRYSGSEHGIENILLKDVQVNYIRQFGRKVTQDDGTSRLISGWETISLPFDVQSITRGDGTAIIWKNEKGLGDFSLREYGKKGFTDMKKDGKMLGGKPYIILMPDDSFATEEDEDKNTGKDYSRVLSGENITFCSKYYTDGGRFTAPEDSEVSDAGFVMHPFVLGYQNMAKTRAENDQTFGNNGEYLLDENGELFVKSAPGMSPNPFEVFFTATTLAAAALESFGVYYGQDPTGAEKPVADRQVLQAYGGHGVIVITTDCAQTVRIVSIDGLVRVCPVNGGTTQIAVPAGLYIVGNMKVLVR